MHRRPPSPYQSYAEKTSAERQRIALVKLRSLYDGRSRFHEIYSQWDINRDGGIDVDEFQTQLHHHGFEWLTNDDVEGLFHRFVPPEKHSLDYKAFRNFMFAHVINDTVWDSTFDPFKSNKNYGWKSARIRKNKKKRKVTNPNPWRRNSSLETQQRDAELLPHSTPSTRSIQQQPLISPLRLAAPRPLPAPLQDVMAEHGNKVMAELKRINGGRLPVKSDDFNQILTNLRQRQGVPLHSSDMPALVSFLSLGNDKKQPYHHVIGRLRQAQRDSARRQRWSDDEKFRSRVVGRSLGFSRPGSPRLGYGAAGNTNLMEERQLFTARRFDGTMTPQSDRSRPSTAQSTAARRAFVTKSGL